MTAIDAHIHFSSHKKDALIHYAHLNGLSYSMAELVASMRRHGIGRGLLLSSPMQPSGILPNREVLRLCENSGTLLAPVITVEPSAKEVKDAIALARHDRKLVKALKIRLGYTNASVNSRVFEPAYNYAESEGLPVLFHTGDTASSNGSLERSHPLNLDGLANAREDLTIVACHFGNPWIEDVAELIYKHPNVYTDISGLITGGAGYAEKYADWLAEKISQAIYFASGAEKVLFGTDYPVTKHSDALALVRSLDVSRQDKERILGRNAARVFGI